MTVKEYAYAKINLFLDVVSLREDGFHDVDTLMTSVSLHDTLVFNVSPSEKKHILIDSNDKSLETNENNLVYKAASKYMLNFGIDADVNVKLTKRIPVGAGLGGGSSDAAATLRAMNRIFGLASNEELLRMASEIGSDVAFCLNGGCSICSGRGEIVQKTTVRADKHVIIAIGEGRVSTPVAYRMLDDKYGDFKEYNKRKTPFGTKDVPIYYNIFESVISNPEIKVMKSIMLKSGSKNTLMSGSGPSVFGLFSNRLSAVIARQRLKKAGFSAFKCKING